MRGVSEDLGMAFVGAFSPRMDDLRKPECRKQLLNFARELVEATGRKRPLPRRTAALPRRTDGAVLRASEPEPAAAASTAPGKRVLVLVDYPESAIGAMARRFAAASRAAGEQVETLGLEDMGIKGGCLGCLKCGQANHCAYEGKDGFIEAYKSKVMGADLLVLAGTIMDRAFSARWKAFFDRSFFNTHQRTLVGKQILVLAAGPLSLLGSLRETLEAYAEWQGANLVDMVSDEAESSGGLDALIDAAAARSTAALAAGAMKPTTFLGVGGMKIFRDDIFDELRIVFKADHRAYTRDGIYDFPQRKRIKRLAIWLGYWITSIPWVHRGVIRILPALMIKQFEPLFARSAVPAKAPRGTGLKA
jgi:hypothetical protein